MIEKLKILQNENHYFAQVNIQGISSSSLRTYRSLAAQRGLKCIHLSIAKANVLDAGYEGCNSLAIFSNDLESLHQFVSECRIVDQYYYKSNDVSDIDYTIPKGNLKIKAGSYLQLFQRVGNIKLSKGFIELLEPVQVLKKGKLVDERHAQVLQVLQKRLKLRKSQVVGLGSLIDGKKVKRSSQHVKMVYDIDQIDRMAHGLLKFVKSHDRSQPISIAPYVHTKLSRFINILNNLNIET